MDSFRQYENLNIDEVCRICLIKQDHMSFISEAGLPDLLLECASIQVLDEDILHLVCNHCCNEVSRWYIFKQQVMQSFEIGRWLIKQKYLKSDVHNANINYSSQQTIEEPLQYCKQPNSDATNSVNNENNQVNSEFLLTTKPTREKLKKVNYCEENSMLDVPPQENVETIATSSNLICDICNKNCPTANALARHKKIHKDTKDYMCTKCGKAFKQSQTLADHMKRHYDLRKYACNQCGKRFYKQYNVNMHMRIHTGEKPYKCTECDKAFSRPLLLRNHIKQRHTNEKKYICQICSKGFIDGWQLKIHLRTHTGEKPHKCPHCEMSFAVSSSLHSHIRYKHTFEKNFICSMCAKAFTAKHTLDDHMRIHTGEKKPPKHECPTCGKMCDSTSTLKYHIRAVHTKERPFGCELCDKTFVRKQHLTAHMRNHSGEKPFVCPQCGKAFSSSSSFSIHKRIHSGERPFVCTVCNHAFIQSAGLKQHMKTHEK